MRENSLAATGLTWVRAVRASGRILPDVGELDAWKHCPRCAGELERHDGSSVECPSCGFRHYASSKPTASALVLDGDGRILLARRAVDPDRGKWDLPGGFLEEGEEPRDALVRELREETSLEVAPTRFFDVVVDRYGDEDDAQYTLNLYWVCRVISGEPQPDDDVEALEFRNNAAVLSRWRDEDA